MRAKSQPPVEKVKMQKTVQAKDYGDETCNRLAIILVALNQMDERARAATFGYLKATYAKEWPSDSNY